MDAGLRWPPLGQRVLQALNDGGGMGRTALLDALEVSPGNEWLVDETLEDLLAASRVQRDDGAWRLA
jgi:hypothetical protein